MKFPIPYSVLSNSKSSLAFIVLCTLGMFGTSFVLRASEDDLNRVGTVNIKFDRTAEICDITINYRGERYKQSIPVSSDHGSGPSRLNMLVEKHTVNTTSGHFRTVLESSKLDRKPNKGKYFSYRLLGMCSHEVSEDVIRLNDQKIHLVAIDILIPSTELAHDGESILAGATPTQLVRKGFSLTHAPVFETNIPLFAENNSSDNDSVDEIVQQLESLEAMQFQQTQENKSSIHAVEERLLQFDIFLAIKGKPENSEEKFWICFLQQIRPSDGTFTVQSAKDTVAQQYIEESPPSLHRYSVDIDQWEFNGRIFGYSC